MQKKINHKKDTQNMTMMYTVKALPLYMCFRLTLANLVSKRIWKCCFFILTCFTVFFLLNFIKALIKALTYLPMRLTLSRKLRICNLSELFRAVELFKLQIAPTAREELNNKRPMGHIAHLRKQFKSINTYVYIIKLIKKNHYLVNENLWPGFKHPSSAGEANVLPLSHCQM